MLRQGSVLHNQLCTCSSYGDIGLDLGSLPYLINICFLEFFNLSQKKPSQGPFLGPFLLYRVKKQISSKNSGKILKNQEEYSKNNGETPRSN